MPASNRSLIHGSPSTLIRRGNNACPLRTPRMPNRSPGGAARSPLSVIPAGKGKRRCHLTWHGVRARGSSRSRLRAPPGCKGVAGGDQPHPGQTLGGRGFAALRQEPRLPAAGSAERGGAETRSQPPGGGARAIRSAPPTRPLSGAKARGWALDLQLQMRTAKWNSGRNMLRSNAAGSKNCSPGERQSHHAGSRQSQAGTG